MNDDSSSRNGWGEASHAVRRCLLDHIPYLVVVAAYVLVGTLLLRSLPRQVPLLFGESYQIPVVFTALYLAGTLFLSITTDVIVARRPPFARRTWLDLLDRRFGPSRLCAVVLVLVTLPALLTIMIGFRTAITSFHPFSWDPAFMRFDSVLHGGAHPWQLIQPVVGHPAVTRFVDAFYIYGWFVVLWVGLAWQTVHGREPVRSQFLLTFALNWVILGTVAAIVFSSAGPVYFSRVTGLADPYLPLMSYLRQVDSDTALRVISVQEGLWSRFTEWGGITAMPSMHVAQTTTVVLAAIRTDRRLIYLAAPILLIILVGSVHLGWHYAIDGYASLLGTCAIWWLSGRFVFWWQERP